MNEWSQYSFVKFQALVKKNVLSTDSRRIDTGQFQVPSVMSGGTT